LLARVDDESEVGIKELAPSEDSESGDEEEEECEITDSEEGEEGESCTYESFFMELLANRGGNEEGSLSQNFNGRYQRSSQPSQRTLYRRAANEKELAKAVSGSAKITTFFRAASGRQHSFTLHSNRLSLRSSSRHMRSWRKDR
jgi:hypothetical protein